MINRPLVEPVVRVLEGSGRRHGCRDDSQPCDDPGQGWPRGPGRCLTWRPDIPVHRALRHPAQTEPAPTVSNLKGSLSQLRLHSPHSNSTLTVSTTICSSSTFRLTLFQKYLFFCPHPFILLVTTGLLINCVRFLSICLNQKSKNSKNENIYSLHDNVFKIIVLHISRLLKASE